MVEVMKIQKVPCRHWCTQCPQPCSRPPPTHASTRDSGQSQASLGQSLLGSLLLSPGSWCTQCSVCALPESVSPFLCKSEVAQSCLTFWDPMDCNLPGFSVHGIFQARVLEWVAISFSRGSSWPRDQTWVFHIVGRHFTIWATFPCFLTLKSC